MADDNMDSDGSPSSGGGASRTSSGESQSRTSSAGNRVLWKQLTESDFSHYVRAQNQDYKMALSELRGGRKESHWIWYIMPMMAGIGFSHMCQTYGVPSLDHATAYLLHPVLGPRLSEVVSVLHQQICERGLKLQRLMGSDVDALKAVSCLVLYRAAAQPLMDLGESSPFNMGEFCDQATHVLDAVAPSYPACPFTTDYLKRQQAGQDAGGTHQDAAKSDDE